MLAEAAEYFAVRATPTAAPSSRSASVVALQHIEKPDAARVADTTLKELGRLAESFINLPGAPTGEDAEDAAGPAGPASAPPRAGGAGALVVAARRERLHHAATRAFAQVQAGGPSVVQVAGSQVLLIEEVQAAFAGDPGYSLLHRVLPARCRGCATVVRRAALRYLGRMRLWVALLLSTSLAWNLIPAESQPDYEMIPFSVSAALYSATCTCALASVPFELLAHIWTRSPLVWYYALNLALYIAMFALIQPDGWVRYEKTGEDPVLNLASNAQLAATCLLLACSDAFDAAVRRRGQVAVGLGIFLWLGCFKTWSSFAGGDPTERAVPVLGFKADLNQFMRTFQVQVGVVAATTAWTAFRSADRLVFLTTPLVGVGLWEGGAQKVMTCGRAEDGSFRTHGGLVVGV